MTDKEITWPDEIKSPLIVVLVFDGMPPLITAFNGGYACTNIIAEIEADLCSDAADLLDKGDGDYLFRATYFEGQYGEYGVCEIAPCWELSLLGFRAMPEVE